ncbi:Cysteine-rich motor neuron 1 protein [Holothuria leucospilota]|uniref:Cysteine-rich motor neuron 1 protein n=1 Tax=Holothuria leucospilota TaxID=206669 RepID=A0A9Q1CAU3_HOLLE|nr:Cysteine-rich motor neuron 1 protein [Holothuria leucospilota]
MSLSSEELCPDGSQPYECFIYPCLFETCDRYPSAECRPNYCGGCNAEFFVDDEKVDCEGEETEDQSTESPVVLDKCDGICPLIYAPVCSTSGKTFSNNCTFDVAKCKDPTLEIASIGECQEDTEEDEETECQRQARVEQEKGLIGNYIPTCEENGDFTVQQCHGSTGYCWCVNENGVEVLNTKRGPTEEIVDCTNIEEETDCQRQARVEQEKGLIGNYIPTCEENGDFTAEQCHGSTGYCWCVNENGVEVLNTKRGPTEGRVDCTSEEYFVVLFRDVAQDIEEDEETECQRQARVEQEKGLIGNYIPTCEENGDFTAQQCHGSTGYCWCVNENGVEALNTKRGPTEKRVDCTSEEYFLVLFRDVAQDIEEETDCQRQARVEQEKGLIGNYIPTCEENGDFTVEQCHGSTGYCWCVNENGVEVLNTKRGPTEERVDCSAPTNNCDGYNDGDEWMPQPCETCMCFKGSKVCASPDCAPAFCDNPVTEGACCPVCPEESTAPPPDCDGYSEGDTWEPQSCEMCSCVLGRKICATPSCTVICLNPIPGEGACCPTCPDGPEISLEIPPPDCDGYAEGDTWEPQPCEMCSCVSGGKSCASPYCAIPCDNPIPGEGACCPTCPEGPLAECDNYSVGDSWSPDGNGCTNCTCETFGKLCITRKCPVPGCFSPKTVEGECCQQCLDPLRARVNNMHVRAKPRVWRGETPVVAKLDVIVRTSTKSENVTGDGLWKLSMWLDSSISGDGERIWSKDQILSDEQAALPLFSSDNLYFDDISVRVGGPGYECPDTDYYYCFEFKAGDEPTVKYTLSAGGKKSLLRCIKAPCID